MARRKKIVATLYATGILALLVVFAWIKVPVEKGPVGSELLNFVHVPVFGVIGAALLGLCAGLFGTRLTRARQYLLASVLAVLLGAASEWVQIYGPRDSDPWDFARNLAGSSCALLLLAALDRGLRHRDLWGRFNSRHLCAAAAATLLVLAALPLILLGEAYRQREARFPVICSFGSVFEQRLIVTRSATLELTSPPSSWGLAGGRRVGRVTYVPGRYPAVLLHEPRPDWEGYGFLELDLFLDDEESLRIHMLIEDRKHDTKFDDRYNGSFDLQPGPNHLRVPLSKIRAAPATRDMDMREIDVVVLFVVEPEHPVTVYLADLRLAPL